METIELAPDGAWRRAGAPWAPQGPLLAVAGDPIAHSLSPRLQTAALRERGLPHAYVAVRAPAGSLAALKARGKTSGLVGLNVTAPLKEEAAGLCDSLTPSARRAGAVNTVRVAGARWEGHNTDVGGIAEVLAAAEGGAGPPDAGFVLGTGGAARAAVLALLERRARRVVVRARTRESERRFRGWLDACGAPAAASVALEPLAAPGGPCPGERAIWIICLAAGVPAAPWLPAAPTAATVLALDLRYGDALPARLPPPWPWRDGREPLLAQGALSFGWWFGEPVPRDAMRAALA